jgi:hypothetical protein
VNSVSCCVVTVTHVNCIEQQLSISILTRASSLFDHPVFGVVAINYALRVLSSADCGMQLTIYPLYPLHNTCYYAVSEWHNGWFMYIHQREPRKRHKIFEVNS